MNEITSPQNQLIKETQSLHRKKNRNELDLFLIEGIKGVREALKNNLEVKNIFIEEKSNFINENFPEEITYKVTKHIIKKIATTESPPQIIATAKQVKYKFNDLLKKEKPILLLIENVKDPGNIGTIIRTAAAAKIDGIIMYGNTVDIYNPKTVRASVANLWKLPIIEIKEISELEKLKLKNFQILATSVANNKPIKHYDQIDYTKPTIIMFGSESEGLSTELIKYSDNLIKIPMNEEVESLNLSISAGVIIYEAFRQRKFI